MVQLVDSGNIQSKMIKSLTGVQPESESSNKLPVKLEVEDSLDDEHGPPNKIPKLPAPFQQQWNTGTGVVSSQSDYYNPLAEPSPLGLSLRKSPSLLDLIQMRLSQGDAVTKGVEKSENLDSEKKKEIKCATTSASSDKLKASNFPASILRIGTWECVSRYEGDLVAKCYFAKHKLVWEVLDGGLKSKIEIQWSDITALKASCPDSEPGTLDIVLARQPLFFRETNPQPRKHTLWQATSDFTGGQATMHRRHFLQCPQGLLNKHFEKLIQCDPRLNLLSRRPEIVLDSPYFEPRGSVFEHHDEPKCHDFGQLNHDYISTFSGFQDTASPSNSKLPETGVRVPDSVSRETPSPSSVMDSRFIEETVSSENEEFKELSQWDQFKVPGLSPSMSMSDLVSHIGFCISEQMNSGNPLFSGEGGSWNRDKLEEITQHLLSDSQFSLASDEQSLMSRVNSLCCLLQKDGSQVQNLQAGREEDQPRVEDKTDHHLYPMPEMASREDGSSCGCKQLPALSRKESVGDLLLHLPRIASLPQFLFNISDDVNNRAR